MRFYTREAGKRARNEATWHFTVAVTILCGIALSLPWMLGLVAMWHLLVGRERWLRGRTLCRHESGYVDITPGIQVVRLRPERDRSREPESIFRN